MIISPKGISIQDNRIIPQFSNKINFIAVYTIILNKRLIIIQKIAPINVGNNAANTTHFKCPVSFFIVINVVAQGQ